jgi:hypothetical protein
MAGHIKSQLESPELTANQSDTVQRRLSACLASDPQHIAPGQQGDHVKAIQGALDIIRQRLPNLGLVKITDSPGAYGDDGTDGCTAEVVLKYKTAKQIFRPGRPIDKIVGRMTITEIDDDLVRSKPAPPPKPVPPPEPPPPVVGGAGVQIGSIDSAHGDQSSIVVDYYTSCSRETIGPGQVATLGIERFKTLEDLIDTLLKRSELHQVVVNHGNPDKGLLMLYCRESRARDTGTGIGNLSALADRAQQGPLDPKNSLTKQMLKDAATDMKVPEPSRPVVLRIVDKLVKLRKKQFVMHFRACQLQDPALVRDYKNAFGARMITFHPTRILFLKIKPDQFRVGHSSAEFNSNMSVAQDRIRVFEDPLGTLPNLVLEIIDHDLHTNVEPVALIDRPLVSGQIKEWATFLLGQWRGSETDFVMPVMWKNNDELTYHCPLETGWRSKLQFV